MRQPLLLRLIIAPIERFTALSAASGLVLLAATLAALVWANSPAAGHYHDLWEIRLGVTFGEAAFDKPLHHWINDGLMAVFFFVVGLEIKRELLVGELSSLRQATLPVVAAVGGMVVPALSYAAMNQGLPSAAGWGVPMATDIAFALGVLALLGKRVPPSLKIFLTALAIADDLGAVIVIALFYTSQLHVGMLIGAGGIVLLLALANRWGVHTPAFYAAFGALLWWLVLQSGVHATIAGVALAFTVPASGRVSPAGFLEQAQRLLNDLGQRRPERLTLISNAEAQNIVHGIEQGCEAVQAPLHRFEHGLHGWVAFAIMPVFALANAGVAIHADGLASLDTPLTRGIVLGLVIGKPLGIVGFALIARLAGLVTLPQGTRWGDLIGAGLLAGIGFTMSIFIAGLAFGSAADLEHAKMAVLLASTASAVLGALWFLLFGRRAA